MLQGTLHVDTGDSIDTEGNLSRLRKRYSPRSRIITLLWNFAPAAWHGGFILQLNGGLSGVLCIFRNPGQILRTFRMRKREFADLNYAYLIDSLVAPNDLRSRKVRMVHICLARLSCWLGGRLSGFRRNGIEHTMSNATQRRRCGCAASRCRIIRPSCNTGRTVQ